MMSTSVGLLSDTFPSATCCVGRGRFRGGDVAVAQLQQPAAGHRAALHAGAADRAA